MAVTVEKTKEYEQRYAPKRRAAARRRYKEAAGTDEYKRKRKKWTGSFRKASSKWYKKNKRRHILNTQKNSDKRKRIDPAYHILLRLRQRIHGALRYRGIKKESRTWTLLGCDKEIFTKHLESLFKEGMNWENRDLWDIDHIIPCKNFDLTKIEEQNKCFHYTNLQPLWCVDHQKKTQKEINERHALLGISKG